MEAWNLILNEFSKPNFTELEMTNEKHIFFKSDGKRVQFNSPFKDIDEYTNSLNDLLSYISNTKNKNIDDFNYLIEGRITFRGNNDVVNIGRAHIILPPICDVPQVTITKKSLSLTTLEDIYKSGSMDPIMLKFMKAIVKLSLTTVISGGTGAGKTTFLEALTKEWDNNLRIGVAEDTPELVLKQSNVSYLQSSPLIPGHEDTHVSLDWVVQQLNRMRVDKIIVGETRSKEFFYFLQAANSGCEGSLTTIHAKDPKMCLQKMTQFSVMAMPQPMRTANRNISSTIDIIIQLERLKNGSYKVINISEVSEILGNNESADIVVNKIFEYDYKQNKWQYNNSQMSDRLKNLLRENGYIIDNLSKRSY